MGCRAWHVGNRVIILMASDPRLNGAQGFLDGFQTPLNIINTIDERKYRQEDRAERKRLAKKQEGRADTLYEQSQEDRTKNNEYQETLRGRETELYSEGKIDREQARVDAETQRERSKYEFEQKQLLFPLEQRLAKMRLSGQYTENQIADANLKLLKQQEKTEKASGLVRQAMALSDAGDLEGAIKAYEQLGSEYKMDVEGMAKNGGKREAEVMTKIVAGELAIDSDEGRWLAKEVLTPTMVMSGRDTDRYEVAGLRESRPGKYAVELRDNETGEFVPATFAMTSDDTDLITEVSQDDLMTAVQTRIQLASHVQELTKQQLNRKLKGEAARLGIETKDKKPLSVAQQKWDDELANRDKNEFLATYEDKPELKAIAAKVIEREGYDPKSTASTVEQIDRMALKSGIHVQAAAEQYYNDQELQQIQVKEVANMTKRYPMMDEKAALKVVEMIAKDGKSEQEALKRVLDPILRKKARAMTKDEVPLTQDYGWQEGGQSGYNASTSKAKKTFEETLNSLRKEAGLITEDSDEKDQ